MLRVVAHKSAAAARQYYAEGLKREDYYAEGQEIKGRWHGLAASYLGLEGEVAPEQFAALVENRHPRTGDRLTPRTKEGRIVGYDLNFHAPKSLSVLYGLTSDEDILRAFRKAVAETMEEIEGKTATRVRRGGAAENRVTGNLAWAEFIHFTARPVGGIPDPHLHCHAFAFNCTWDSEERRWKAAKFRDIKKDAPYSEALFHSKLTAELSAQGYAIERTKTGWEIKGMPESVLTKFSRRTAEIERTAQAKGITDPKAKDALGAATREGKRRGMTWAELLAAWSVRLTPEEKILISKVCYDKDPNQAKQMTPEAALDYAGAKVFAKNAVVPLNRYLAEAMRYGVGQVTTEQIREAAGKRGLVVRDVEGETLCTSFDVLGEEVALINAVRNGRGRAVPFQGAAARFTSGFLSRQQSAAVRHILESSDQVVAIRGGAGVGKTTLMKEAVSAIENTGKRVYAFAPSAVASRETLRDAGFQNAETVAHLFANPKLQVKTRGQVIWIDEAGLLGTRELQKVMEIAGQGTRVILTGDTKQHAPVSRGDGLRLLEEHAGLKVAEVTQIRRQERAEYRKAVAALSKGDMKRAFNRLDRLGAIVEVAGDEERYRELARDYVALAGAGHPPLVVSPTHGESAKVTGAIRESMREKRWLGAERQFLRYEDLRWEDADKMRPENYMEGLVVQFHQNAHGFTRGEILRVTGRSPAGEVEVKTAEGDVRVLALGAPERFQVFAEERIALGRGDRIRITRNGKSADGRRLNNGNVFTIEKFTKTGDIVLTTGAILNYRHGHLAYGYCQTSHSSQSKSVKDVLVAQSADSFLASSREQFYVSVSRGKENIRIYTDSRRGLQEAVGNSSARMAGLELAGFSKDDLSEFMSGEMNAEKWQEALARNRGNSGAEAFQQRLARERRKEGLKKGEVIDWRKYVEMRKGMMGPDGKSRSKGHPVQPGKSRGQLKTGGLAKTSLHTEPFRQRVQRAAEAKKEGTPHREDMKQTQAKPRTNLKDRVQANVKTAKENFSKVKARGTGSAEKPAKGREIKVGNATLKSWPPRTKAQTARVAEHSARHRRQEIINQARARVKVQTQAPAPRRGK